MKISRFKQGLARMLVLCLLLCDTLPAVAQTANGDVTPQESLVYEQEIGTTDGSTGDGSDGDVSAGDSDVVFSVNQTIFTLDEDRPITDVLYSAKFTYMDADGNMEIFSYLDEPWFEKNMEAVVIDSWGNEESVDWYDYLYADDTYTIKVYSETDKNISCEMEVSCVEVPIVRANRTYSFTNWYAGTYRFWAKEKGYYKLELPEGYANITVVNQESFHAGPEKDAYLVAYSYDDEWEGYMNKFRVNNSDFAQEYAATDFKISKVELQNMKLPQSTTVAMNYGTWGYSVATGSVNASGNNPVSGNNPIPANYEIGENSKYNLAVAFDLDLTAGFEGDVKHNISNYSTAPRTDRRLWEAMDITQRLTKEDGSNAVTDDKGYLPKGNYKMTYTASNGTSVEIPFTIKDAKPIEPKSVQLSAEKLSLEVGDGGKLTADILPADANTKTELTWKSSNPNVVTVEDGRYYAKKAGSATITVKTKNGKTDSCKVTVTQGRSPYRLVLHSNIPGRTDCFQWYCYYGDSYLLLDNGYTRTGYTLKKWNTKPNGKGKSYDVNQSVKNLTTEYDGEYHLYAQWYANTYEVAFESGVEGNAGVKGSMKKQKFTYDKVAALSANKFKREGYDFAGWLDKNGNIYRDKQAIVNLVEEANGVAVLTAMWQPAMYKITYKNAEHGKNGVLNDSNPVGYYKASGTIYLSAPERQGYEFGGWFTKSSMKEADRITSIDTSKGGNITLYAKWIAKKITIKFESNMPADALQGTTVKGTMKDLSATFGKTKKLPKNAYKIDGYKFVGWCASADGQGVLIKDSEELTYDFFDVMADSQSKTLTLYAVWDYTQYKITYVNAENGKNGVTNSYNQTSYTVLTKEITLADPVRNGFVFEGWYTKSSMKDADKLKDGVLRIEKPGNIKVYAKWSAKKATIHFNANFPEGVTGSGTMKDLSATAGKTKNLPKNAYKVPGYTFVGWCNLPEGEGDTAVHFADKASMDHYFFWWYEEVTVYAQWELTEYPITYVNAIPGKNGVTVNENPTSFNVKDEDFVLSNPQRPGYDFGGWYTSSSMKEADRVTTFKIGEGKAVKIYAKWNPHKATVHFVANKPVTAANDVNVTGTMKDLAVTYGKTKSLGANKFKLAGYVFDGWNTEADGSGISYANKAKITPELVEETAVTLYAQWSPVKYKINYPNATDGKDGVTNPNPTYYTSEHSMISQGTLMGQNVLVLEPATRVGYYFDGWRTDKELQHSFNGISTRNRKPITLYAAWEANRYYITFDANATDATGQMETVTTSYDTSLYLPVNQFVREGYVFAGWSTVPEPGANDAIYANMAQVKNLSDLHYDVVVLYAQWRAL